MRFKALFLLAIFLSILTVCLLNSCDEKCDPCDTGCPDPALRFIGVWIVFEAYYNRNPYPEAIGMEMDFRTGDSLIAFSDTLKWYATHERLFLYQESQQAMIGFEYYFEIDTLDMTGTTLGDTIRFRMLEEESMPQP